MPTALQKSLTLPILLELAVRGEAVNVGKRNSELGEFQDWVGSYWPQLTKRAKTRVLRGGQSEYYNSHQWAIKELKRDGFVRGKNYVDFNITRVGLRHVQREICGILSRPKMSEHVSAMMTEFDENGRELFVNLLRRLTPDEVHDVLEKSLSQHEVFLHAFLELDPDNLGGFLASAYEFIQPLVGNEMARRHRLAV